MECAKNAKYKSNLVKQTKLNNRINVLFLQLKRSQTTRSNTKYRRKRTKRSFLVRLILSIFLFLFYPSQNLNPNKTCDADIISQANSDIMSISIPKGQFSHSGKISIINPVKKTLISP